MKVIWVLDNIEETESFYSRFNMLCLLASVRLWKRNHPQDKCVLYCDSLTLSLLKRLNVDWFWDIIEPFKHDPFIDRKIFWAASKPQVLSTINEPVILMDNDTLVYKPFSQYLDGETVLVCNTEEGKGYYPTGIDPFIRNLSYKARWQQKSVNVSFLYLPDPKFTREYANNSLQMMREFTELKAPNSQYLIFAEQLLLRHMMDENNIKYRPIITNSWNCTKWNWNEDENNGIWPIRESQIYFKHYGPEKDYFRANKSFCNYEEEVKKLENCVNFTNLDELKKYKL